MSYVAHDCRNSRLSERSKNYCNNRWVDKDLTGAITQIPTWKYYEECCKKLGIDFENQKPSDYMSEEEKEMRRKNLKLGRKINIKSEQDSKGNLKTLPPWVYKLSSNII